MKPYVYFIHGLPGQNESTVDKTVKAIERSMDEGAERIILYRFQALPMSALRDEQSAPPSIRDTGSKRIHDMAAKANTKIKEEVVGSIIRVVIAEKYDKDRRFLVAYPLKHGPVVLVKSSDKLKGSVLDVKILSVSERMVVGSPVAMF